MNRLNRLDQVMNKELKEIVYQSDESTETMNKSDKQDKTINKSDEIINITCYCKSSGGVSNCRGGIACCIRVTYIDKVDVIELSAIVSLPTTQKINDWMAILLGLDYLFTNYLYLNCQISIYSDCQPLVTILCHKRLSSSKSTPPKKFELLLLNYSLLLISLLNVNTILYSKHDESNINSSLARDARRGIVKGQLSPTLLEILKECQHFLSE
jgi:hypothetical protein